MHKYWIPGPISNYGTTDTGFCGEVRVVLASDYDALAAELAALKAILPCGHPKSMDDSYGGCVWCTTMHTLTTLEDEYDALKARLAACERANAELNVEVSRLYSCRNELQEVTAAVDDPSVNNTRTLADAVRGFKARLAACERDAAALRKDNGTLNEHLHMFCTCSTCNNNRAWDAAIDAARAGHE